MLENRSFDHMFGFRMGDQYKIDGLDVTEFNVDASGTQISVTRDANFPGAYNPDPGHYFPDVTTQIFGTANGTGAENMSGFIRAYGAAPGSSNSVERKATLRCRFMQIRKACLLFCGFLPWSLLASSYAQESSSSAVQHKLVSGTVATAAEAPMKKNPFVPCPGSFPTDLTMVNNCEFNMSKRLENFAAGSLTDQAMAGAAFYSLISQGMKSPDYWRRTWEGYGLRVGVRYNQSVAKGAAQMLTGVILRDDPRHVSYQADPRHYAKYVDAALATPEGKPVSHLGWKRTWHAVFDSITVRSSKASGLGRRMPAFSRFAADFGSAYGGYAWYRGPDNKFDKAGMRAAGSLGSELVSSFYTEFKPELSKVVGALFKRGGTRNK
jgi:hypothetical protein